MLLAVSTPAIHLSCNGKRMAESPPEKFCSNIYCQISVVFPYQYTGFNRVFRWQRHHDTNDIVDIVKQHARTLSRFHIHDGKLEIPQSTERCDGTGQRLFGCDSASTSLSSVTPCSFNRLARQSSHCIRSPGSLSASVLQQSHCAHRLVRHRALGVMLMPGGWGCCTRLCQRSPILLKVATA